MMRSYSNFKLLSLFLLTASSSALAVTPTLTGSLNKSTGDIVMHVTVPNGSTGNCELFVRGSAYSAQLIPGAIGGTRVLHITSLPLSSFEESTEGILIGATVKRKTIAPLTQFRAYIKCAGTLIASSIKKLQTGSIASNKAKLTASQFIEKIRAQSEPGN